LPIDLKTLTPDTTVPSTAVLFGADSQGETNPSVYPLPSVRDGVNVGDIILTDAPFISWNVETSRIATVTLGGNRTLLSPTNHKDGGEYKLLVFQDGTGGRTLAYDGNIVWPGGTAPNLSGAAANSLIVITLVSDGVRLYASADQTYTGSSPTLYHNFASGVLPSWMTFTRTGHATMVDSSGRITWAPNNMLLNSATLSTQSVATAGGHSNILSFRGTGSVTLSGSATGTLAGTGVNNRVSLVIAPNAGSLTLTVTGQVLDAQLERVTHETTPRAYNPTTGVAFFGPRFDWTGGTPGLLLEEARTNSNHRSSDFSHADYGVNLVTKVGGQLAPDGTLTATLIYPDSTGATRRVTKSVISQGVVTTTTSVYAKFSGIRWVYIYAHDGSSVGAWFDVENGVVGQVAGGYSAYIITLPNGWFRLVLTGIGTATIFSGYIGLSSSNNSESVTANGTDGVLLWGLQTETGGHASSYVYTTSASSVTRAVDNTTLVGAAYDAIRSVVGGSVVVEIAAGSRPVASARIINTNAGASHSPLFVNSDRAVGAWDGTVITTSIVGALSMHTNTIRAGGSWQNSVSRSIVYNGGTVVTSAMVANFNSATSVSLGSAGQFNGRFNSIGIYNYRLTDAALQAKSVVGASY
jgi:hypothetical protein